MKKPSSSMSEAASIQMASRRRQTLARRPRCDAGALSAALLRVTAIASPT
jgi:hypothetical protein